MTNNQKTASAILIVATALTAFCSAQGGGLFGGNQRRVLIQEGGNNISRVYQIQGKLYEIAKTWADADEDERTEMAEKAMVVLNKEFDSDFEAREKSVEQLEKRLNKLKQQLDRRASKKDEIVKLRLQQLRMDWEGLGWNDRGARRLSGSPARIATSDVIDLDMDVVRTAATDKVDKLMKEHFELLRELDPHNINTALWGLVTEDDLELSDELWLEAAQIAEKAAGKIKVTSSPSAKGSTLDTAAHLYYNGGDVDKAIKLQEAAVELNPDSQLEEFLRTLKFTKKEAALEAEE